MIRDGNLSDSVLIRRGLIKRSLLGESRSHTPGSRSANSSLDSSMEANQRSSAFKASASFRSGSSPKTSISPTASSPSNNVNEKEAGLNLLRRFGNLFFLYLIKPRLIQHAF